MLSFGICVFTVPGTFKVQYWDGMQPLGLAGDAGGRFLDQSSELGAAQSVKSQLQQPLLKGVKGVKWLKPRLTSGTSLFPELFQVWKEGKSMKMNSSKLLVVGAVWTTSRFLDSCGFPLSYF